MSWSYSGDPSSSAKDKVRFLVGDTDTDDQLLNDAEVLYVITESGGSIYQSAHDAAYAIASKFTRMASSKSVGDMSVSYSNRASSYFLWLKHCWSWVPVVSLPTPVGLVLKTLLGLQKKNMPPANGTEFYTGQTDYLRP